MRLLLLALFIAPIVAFSQEIPTRGEIFNYQVGDEFHSITQPSNHPPSGNRFRVLDVNYSEDLETVTYTIYRFGYSSELDYSLSPPVIWEFYNDTIDVEYSDLSAPIIVVEDVESNEEVTQIDSIYTSSELFCDQSVIGRFEGTYTWEDYEIQISEYSSGLGLVHGSFTSSFGAGGGGDTDLVYFSKGDWECGEPDLFTSVDEVEEAIAYSVFPNPIQNVCTLDFGSSIVNVASLVSIDGKIVATFLPNRASPTLAISSVPAGLYFLKIQVNGNWHTERVVIE